MNKTVDINNTPTIFPKYTAMLMERGVNVEIAGNRETDNKLASVIYSAVLSNTINELPDMMQYDTKSKTWKSIHVPDGGKVTLKNGSNFVVEYMNFVNEWTQVILNAVKNFVAQFSASRIQF